MKRVEGREREIEAVREKISGLGAAILRISASLDPVTVLREVLESARALTDARYGIITTVDESGHPTDFITSGFSDEEHARFEAWPEGRVLFEHFRVLEAPLRVADLPAYVRALGFSTELIPAKAFQGTPMRHRGENVGIFFLGGKEGEAGFTAEDEELLVLFASQAATAIVNARTYRDERQARADLEALVDTSPVGVLVLDAATGLAASFNREARRMVERLRMPGGSPEDLLKVITCRRADGREIALDRFPLAEALRTRRDGARRGDRALGPRRAQPHRAHQRDADPLGRRRRSPRWWSPCRTLRRSRSSSARGRSSWGWSATSCVRRWPRSRGRP